MLISRILPPSFLFFNPTSKHFTFLLFIAFRVGSGILSNRWCATFLVNSNMVSWKKTITTPFRKACTFFNQQQQQQQQRDKKSQTGHDERSVMDLQGEVMACGYEDVQVMWSILDKSKPIS